MNFGDISVDSNISKVLRTVRADEVPDFKKCSLIRVRLDNDFKKDNDAAILFEIKDPVTYDFLYWRRAFLIHFPDKGFNQWQTGEYSFEIKPGDDYKSRIYNLCLSSGKYTGKLKNFRVLFMGYR